MGARLEILRLSCLRVVSDSVSVLMFMNKSDSVSDLVL